MDRHLVWHGRRPALACLLLAALLRASSSAQGTFDVLHVFGGGDGLVPLGAL